MPEKSGMAAPPSAGRAVCESACPEAGIAVAANINSKKKSRRCALMMSSIHDRPCSTGCVVIAEMHAAEYEWLHTCLVAAHGRCAVAPPSRGLAENQGDDSAAADTNRRRS